MCGSYTFSEYMGAPRIKRCSNCGYRERVVLTDDSTRLSALIKIHKKELSDFEEEQKKMDTWRCEICGWDYGTHKGEDISALPDYPTCRDHKKHKFKKVKFKRVDKIK